MKKLRFYAVILFTAFTATFTSCDDDDNQPKGEFEHGVFVVNEGNFSEADGTVSHIGADGTVTQDLFGTINNGLALGSVVQSMTIHDNLSYIVVNNSNKIEVVDANTFVSEYTLTGLSLPRYFTTFDGKGYVTEWVNFSDPGRVSIVDLQAHETVESITTDYGAENIIVHQGKLYVSNNFTNTVSVIDPAKKEVIKTIEVGSGPGELLIDNQDMIWVICGGGLDENYEPLDDGKLVQIDPAESSDVSSNSVKKTIDLNMNMSGKGVINKAKNKIYYYKGKSVYAVSTSDTEGPSDPLVTEPGAVSFYGIGIDPEDDILYVGDSKNFAGNGVVYRYTLSGAVVDNVEAGRGPNGFVFK